MKNWKNFCKRGISLAMVLVMCLSLLPMSAFAADAAQTKCGVCGSEDIKSESGNSGHYLCKNCGAEYKKAWSGGDPSKCTHNFDQITIPAIPATCTSDGLTEGKQCSNCQTITVEQEVDPASHGELSTEWTATEDGQHVHMYACGLHHDEATAHPAPAGVCSGATTCATCGLGVAEDANNHGVLSTKWTATEDGQHVHMYACGLHYDTETAHEPDFNDGNCQTDKACSKCDIPGGKGEHSWSTEWTNDGTNHWHVCTVCGAVDSESVDEHDYNADYVCTVCGEKKPASYQITMVYSRVSIDGQAIPDGSEPLTFDGYVGQKIHTGDVYFDQEEVGDSRSYNGLDYYLVWNWRLDEWNAAYVLEDGPNDIGALYYWHWDADAEGDGICDNNPHCLHDHTNGLHCGHDSADCGNPFCLGYCDHNWGDTYNEYANSVNVHYQKCSECHDVKKVDHSYDFDHPSWSWSADNSRAQVTFYCTVPGCWGMNWLCNANHTIPADMVQVTSEVITAATCTQPGKTRYIATVVENGRLFTSDPNDVIVPATGEHTPGTPVQENVNPATCGEDGSYEEVTYCTECNLELSREGKTIDATGNHQNVTYTMIPTSTGKHQGVCDDCGTVVVESDDHHGSPCTECGRVLGDIYLEYYQCIKGETPTKVTQNKSQNRALLGFAGQTVTGADLAARSDLLRFATRSGDSRTYEFLSSDPTSLTFTQGGGSYTITLKYVHYHVDEDAKEGFCDECGTNICKHEGILVETPANNPTCLAGGNYAYWTCSVCEKVFSDSAGTKATTVEKMTRSALGHWFPTISTNNSKVAYNPATCTEDGNVEYYVCKRAECGKYFLTKSLYSTNDVPAEQLVIPATGHTLSEHHDAVTATCTEDGNIEYWTCEVCLQNFSDAAGTVVAENVITTAPDNHVGEPGEWMAVVIDGVELHAKYYATCGHVAESGLHTYDSWYRDGDAVKHNCKVCGYIETYVPTEEYPVPVDHVCDELIPVGSVAPTCTETGLTAGTKCSICGSVISGRQVIAMLPHTYGDWTRVSDPTETVAGVDARYCADCAGVDYRIVDALGEVEIDENDTPLADLPFQLDPQEELTRGHLIYVLYWFEGEPDAAACTFTDVSGEAYYSEALGWAEENGIAEAYLDGTFEPEEIVTRKQMETFLNLYKQYLGFEEEEDQVSLDGDPEAKMLWGEAETILNEFFLSISIEI